MTSRAVAQAAGWDESKCSRLIHGRTPPSDDDIRAWCTICGVPNEIPNLISASRNVESAYMEFRRVQRSQKRMQVLRTPVYERSTRYRMYSSSFVPWPLQTASYIQAVMEHFNQFHEAGSTDTDEGVAERLGRQRQYLALGKRRCQIVIEEGVLYDRTYGSGVMREQLAHLLAGPYPPGTVLGIIPRGGNRAYHVAETFNLYEDTVVVETVSAIITVTQPREIALYVRCFDDLAQAAVYGSSVRELVTLALAELG